MKTPQKVLIRQELIIQETHPVFKGFGFDLITDDYKIVAIAFGVVEPITCVYSLKKDSWSEIPRSVSICNFDLKLVNDACFINGILHWVVDDNMTIRPTQVVPEETRRFILTFDLGSHVFGRILLPKRWEVKQLTAINGCLALVYSRGCDVWKIRVMKEYNEAGSSWPVVYRFKQEGYDVIRAVQLVSNGDLFAHFEGLKVYDRRKMLRSVIEPLRFRPRWFMETYVESLELLNEERATTFGETIFTYTRKDKFKRICLKDDDYI
ncbi:hypothetical protein QVD17_27635 [Tagetes erecta]|uniref:F-box associated beta-propeller type 1 domain-containing protein n=1 Tax=Tagetes erecta TaxID=13708 RepID=A0AAD8K8V1_TARER|nr:hypothetical protein QVD17_27635 [Tagetes erecta]